MDFYNQPVQNTFLTSMTHWFEMPRVPASAGSDRVIAVTQAAAQYWIIAYSIIVGSIFVAVARLVTSLVLTYYPVSERGTPNIILVAFFNSDQPTSALIQMYNFIYRALFNTKVKTAAGNGFRRKTDWRTIKYSCSLAMICIIIIVGSAAAKFLVGGSQLVVRHAARANPATIYYPQQVPDILNAVSSAFQLIQPIRAAAAYQAVGRVEAAKANVVRLVNIDIKETTTDGVKDLDLRYSYTISGEDMGLQLASGLIYNVQGRCQTRYDWVNTASKNTDVYPLWGDADFINNGQFDQSPVDTESLYPGYMNISPEMIYYKDPNRVRANRGYEFFVAPKLSHRLSNVENADDPWYMTEPNPGYKSDPSEQETLKPNTTMPFRVVRGRPPVLCYQNDTWSLGDQSVYNVDDLSSIKGLRLSKLFQDIIFPIELAAPPMIQLGNNLGYSVLESSMDTTTSKKSIFASRCSVASDLTRLVHISFVASREVVRNTVLLYSTLLNNTDLPNAAKVDGVVPNEYADFILESKDVAALSVVTLIVVPSIMVFLWILVAIRAKADYGGVSASNNGLVSLHNLRSIALQATQLFAALDEAVSGKQKWSGRTSMTPYIRYLNTEAGDSDGDTESGTGSLSPNPKDGYEKTDPTTTNLNSIVRTSQYIQPKLVPVPLKVSTPSPALQISDQKESIAVDVDPLRQGWKLWRRNTTQMGPPPVSYKLAMTTSWDPNITATFDDVVKNHEPDFKM